MASNQSSQIGQICKYFDKKEGEKSNKTSNKTVEKKEGEQKGDVNPSKRTRSELSSVESEGSVSNEEVNLQILAELRNIKEQLKDTVKKSDLQTTVQETVGNLLQQLKTEMTTKMDDMKKEYDERIIKYKSDVDSLNVDNDRLRGIVQKQNHEIENMKKTVKMSQKVALDSKARSNRNEQYSRKTNIKIHGLDDVRLPNGRYQGTQTTVKEVLKAVAKVTVTDADIIACHRIPGGKSSVRPILLKVKNTDIKSRIMRNRKAFRESKDKRLSKDARLSDDVTKDNGDLIQKLNQHESVVSAWFFNCSVYAKLTGEENEERRFAFDINDNIDKKIKKHLSGEQLDPNAGCKTDSDDDE